MTYEEFLKFVPRKCMYETIYEDSDGRDILVIKMLDAYGMVNKAQRQWVALTGDDIAEVWRGGEMVLPWDMERTLAIEKILKDKNT